MNKQEFQEMVQAALDNWVFENYEPDPQRGLDAEKGLLYMQEHNNEAPPGLKQNDWDGLEEYAAQIGIQIS